MTTKILASGVVTSEWLSQIDLTIPSEWVTIDGVGYYNDLRIAIFNNFKTSDKYVAKLSDSVTTEEISAKLMDLKVKKAEEFHSFKQELDKYKVKLVPAVATSYSKAKGIVEELVARAAYSDSEKPDQLIVWLTDADGVSRGFQTIYGNGEKRIEKGTAKAGSLAFIHRAIIEQTSIVIAEGWSTACSLVSFIDPNTTSVVMAVDCGNLPAVGEALRAKYPKSELIFAADNDHATSVKTGDNPGLAAATEAAQLVSGVVVFPEGKGSDWNDLVAEVGDLKAKKEWATTLKNVKKEKAKREASEKREEIKTIFLSRDSRETGYFKAVLKNNNIVWNLDLKSLIEDFDAEFRYKSVEGNFLIREAGGFYVRMQTIQAETWAYAKVCNPESKQPIKDYEVREFISALFRRNFIRMTEVNPPGFINFKNGVLKIAGKVFTKREESNLVFMMQVPCEWVPGMATPSWTAWLAEVFGESETKKKVMLEFMGYCLSGDDPTTFDQKALVMLGSGGNGKSTALNLLKFMAGQGDSLGYSVFPLKKFSDHLVCLDVASKLFNVSSEEGLYWSDEISQIFKKIVSGEEMSARAHHKEFFTYRARFKLIMACNTAPMSRDGTDGLYRRMIYLKFDKSFIGKEDHSIESRLKVEASGIIEEALRAYAEARLRGGFTVDLDSVETKEEMQESSDWVHDFFDDYLVLAPGELTTTGDIYEKFLLFKDEVSMNSYVTKGNVIKSLCSALKLEKGRNSKSRCVKGIAIRGAARLDSGGREVVTQDVM